MKTLFTLSLVVFLGVKGIAQNCSAPSTGFTPINDLGAGTFTTSWNVSWQGGLYPNGSNYLPSAHKIAGLSQVSLVIPRDQNGLKDTSNGKIVWLSIGMSNTTQETQKFIPLANSFQNINPKLILVDGAQGGQSASVISSPWNTSYLNYWNTVNTRLATAGVTAQQVQVIWFKEADQATKYTNVKDYYDSMLVMIPRIMNDIKIRFPNAQLCYMASRISARYATSALNPEPYSYYTGWAVKKVIENQINGNTQLQFSGSTAKSPWLSWGIYMWSDGITPQVSNPKIFWTCPDFVSDGTHPSQNGQQKVANLLLDYFSTDSTTTPWFLKASSITTSIKNKIDFKKEIQVSPNPSSGIFILTGEFQEWKIYDLNGKFVCSGVEDEIDLSLFSSGLYVLQARSGSKIYYMKIVKNQI